MLLFVVIITINCNDYIFSEFVPVDEMLEKCCGRYSFRQYKSPSQQDMQSKCLQCVFPDCFTQETLKFTVAVSGGS